jgi:MFS transporter
MYGRVSAISLGRMSGAITPDAAPAGKEGWAGALLEPDRDLGLGRDGFRDLQFSETDLQWVATAYALTFGGFFLLGGRAADLLGRRRVLMFGLGLFTSASLGCALAASEAFLIAMRAAQGDPRPSSARAARSTPRRSANCLTGILAVTYPTLCQGPYDDSVRYREFMG